LRARSCIVDGEAVACGDDGIASFERMRDWRNGDSVFRWAFDLIELNGDDLHRDPLVVRKATLASLVVHTAPGDERRLAAGRSAGALAMPPDDLHVIRLSTFGRIGARTSTRGRSEGARRWEHQRPLAGQLRAVSPQRRAKGENDPGCVKTHFLAADIGLSFLSLRPVSALCYGQSPISPWSLGKGRLSRRLQLFQWRQNCLS
jgi:hypothetical protein